MTARNDALEKLAHLRRRAYRPVLEEGDGLPTDGKLGGAPYLSAEAPLPRCRKCSAPLALLAQLNSGHFPEPLRKEFGDGLLQVFSCLANDSSCGAFSARLIKLAGDPASPVTSAAPAALPARVIRSWSVTDDLPTRAERKNLAATLEPGEEDLVKDATVRGDKLAGWPAWDGDVGYPRCSECNKKMRLVFQLADRGFLTGCPSHKQVLAFVERLA